MIFFMSASTTTFLALLTTLVILLYKYVTGNYDYWKKRNIPYIKPHFPFGNFTDVVTRRLCIGLLFKQIYEKSSEKLVGFWIFRSPHLIIRSPAIIKAILVRDFNHFADRCVVSDERADPTCSKLLLTVKNPEWHLMRKKVSPIFTSNKLKNMTVLINKAAEDLNAYLKKGAEVIDTKEVCAKFTTEVLTSCAFGVDAHCFEDDRAPFRMVGRQLLDTTLLNNVRFVSYFLLPKLVKFFKIRFFDPVAIGFLSKEFWGTIKLREATKLKRNDLIDIIIKLKEKVDIGEGIKFEGERVVAQAIQFYIAGFEGTSSTITHTLYELALNTDIQEKAREEIQRVIEEHGIDYEALLHLKYLEKVIAESLRKCPSLPFLDRTCTADYVVEGLDGVVIPKGTPVFIPMLGIHYDPEYYPDPEKFDPERFSEENVAKRPPFTYFPFGQGPHNCLGERFAMITTKLSLVHILKDFRIETCEDTAVPLKYNPGAFSLQIYGNLPLRLCKI